MEYGYGAHEYPTSGVFEVEPRSCPGFIFRRSVMLGSTDMSRAEFRSFMEHLSGKYHGDTYHLIAKNCNHFTDEVCLRLTGKPIPGWVNRLARFGKWKVHFAIVCCRKVFKLRQLDIYPDHPIYSGKLVVLSYLMTNQLPLVSSASGESEEEEPDHHLLTGANGEMAFVKEKPVKLAKDLL
ncbi:DeSI-like protein [Vitis vinifera]|uniref:DeSI-like protein n=1 Tax=Vitis vinifera TaxID=29760 RepID=A0A438ES71_VITVI|nr:DeSI-like protein [Vitis vinifera]